MRYVPPCLQSLYRLDWRVILFPGWLPLKVNGRERFFLPFMVNYQEVAEGPGTSVKYSETHF